MKFKRAGGVLLHPSSLPGAYGIGDLGFWAYRWVDFLSVAGCKLWQVLPLGPTGYGDSPYQSFSSFAGNPLLISPDKLHEAGLLDRAEIASPPSFPKEKVDFGWVIPWKRKLLEKAFSNFESSPSRNILRDYQEFQESNVGWLEDFSLFMAIKEIHGGKSWIQWTPELRDRNFKELEQVRRSFKELVERQIFFQFLFFQQWGFLRDYAHNQGVQIIGDLPIFVASDSADIWGHRELFYLEPDGHPTYVAGVPPDYFSATGQLWGNPIYRWKVHRSTWYQWWIERLRAVLKLVDIVRLDHFRGFAGYWRVSGKAKTAERGRWVKAPGKDFLRVAKKELGDLPVIAEDLGVITPDVVALRDAFGLPGMKVLQFAFGGGPSDPFLPHNYSRNCVVYTGTHDNDTVVGWYQRVPEEEKLFYREYLGCDGSHVAWDLIRACWGSTAVFALAPMQDFLNLDNRARMNYPGNPSGNWTWRMLESALDGELQARIRKLNYLYSR